MYSDSFYVSALVFQTCRFYVASERVAFCENLISFIKTLGMATTR